MTDAEQQYKISETIRNAQIKYIYYVMALNVAGIVFAIQQTSNSNLENHHIILAGAVLLWSIGLVSGLYYVNKFIITLKKNYAYFSERGRLNEIEKATFEKVLNKALADAVKPLVKKSEIAYKAALYLFYCGSLCFLAWHIVRMINVPIDSL